MISFIEGNWVQGPAAAVARRAEKRGTAGNYLLAARSSDQLQEPDKVHEYLGAAEDAEPTAAVAVKSRWPR